MARVTWSAFSDEILTLYTPPLRAKATYFVVRQVLRELGEAGIKTTRDLTEAAIARWVLATSALRSPARICTLLRTLRPITGRAKRYGYCKYDPMEGRPPKSWLRTDAVGARTKVLRARPIASIGRVLDLVDQEAAGGDWAAERLRALIYLYAFTGVRKGEALYLQVSDIDLVDRRLLITPKDGWRPKTLASAAPLPIVAPLVQVLAHWLPLTGSVWVFPGMRRVGPWTSGAPGTKPLDQIKAAGERAGVPGLTILGFRKTIGTYGKAWGFSQLELKALLRHNNPETQEWYDEERVESLRPAVDKIRFPRLADTG